MITGKAVISKIGERKQDNCFYLFSFQYLDMVDNDYGTLRT